MRVTSSNISESLINQLQSLSRRQVGLQGQIGSGQRVTDPSDDPLAAQQVLGLRDNSAALGQYQKNIGITQEFAQASHDSMSSLQKILNRAEEIAVKADGLDSGQDLKSYATELSELIKQAVQVANAQYRGEYIFGGTKSDTAPFQAATDSEGKVTGVTFNGNTDQAQSEIAPGVVVSARVPGENTTGSGERGLFVDSRYGADLFSHLVTLQQQLSNNDAAGIQSTTRGQLKSDEENLLYHVANNGALQSRLETTLSTNKSEKQNVEAGISTRTDLDLPSAIVKLNQQQTSYQAALQSAGSILNLSLLSFLH